MSTNVPFPAVGEFLKRRRLAKGIYRGNLAEKVGVSPEYLDRCERGERLPAWSVVRKLARELGFKPDELGKIVEQYLPTREELLKYVVPAPTSGP